MIILIAESKTMLSDLKTVSPNELRENLPVTEQTVSSLIEEWKDWNIREISEKIGISENLGRSMKNNIYDFPNKSAGETAIKSFTGVVFRYLDYNSFPKEEKDFFQEKVRIISSLYGILKPNDIIKPYRLDFKTKAAPGNISMSSFWKSKVTNILENLMKEHDDYEILDLLPGDAAACIDWKKMGNTAKRIKIDFKQIQISDNNPETISYKTPSANKLKSLRGKLLRYIINNKITNSRQLEKLNCEDFYFDEEHSSEDKIVLLTD